MTSGDDATSNSELLRHRLNVEAELAHSECNYLAHDIGPALLAWERHGEFMTYTFVFADDRRDIFDLSALAELQPWIAGVRGEVIRSSHLRLTDAEPSQEEIAASFAREDLVVSDVLEGSARIWCDFRLHPDGFGRLLVHDRSLRGSEPGLLLRRLQELGNYRKMALLGLPAVRSSLPVLVELEHRLVEVAACLSTPDSDDERLLHEVSSLSAELAQVTAATGARLGATQAYAELCADRLRRLAVVPVRGFVSFDDFTERRLLPAIRTCEAFAGRLENLSRRAERTTSLLRTRVDMALARRNRDLLASMDRRTALQLRLQHTVEGLSVVACTYYGMGLWHYAQTALEALEVRLPGWTNLVAIAVIGLTAWTGIRALKRRATQIPATHE